MTPNPYQELIGAIILGGYDQLYGPLHIQVNRDTNGTFHLLANERIEVLHARDMFQDLYALGRMARTKPIVAALLEARDSALQRVRREWARTKDKERFIAKHKLTRDPKATGEIWRGSVSIPRLEVLRDRFGARGNLTRRGVYV